MIIEVLLAIQSFRDTLPEFKGNGVTSTAGSVSGADTIRNFKYITVKGMFGPKNLYHVKYLIWKNGKYYYPNGVSICNLIEIHW